MKTANIIFSAFFGLLAFAEIIGAAGGHTHCIYAAIFCAALSLMFWFDSKPSCRNPSELHSRDRYNVANQINTQNERRMYNDKLNDSIKTVNRRHFLNAN